ncbi:glycosyl hydrolase family 95 catalytic domain-containing protein [Paenibacillus sp. B01]|uniref:glycosyl hydrolase family 95 catalytic domain-containing protein n=1 Tax=Paenibacillus sp. B01 TaxID=2660554 RepID=UPI001E4CDE6B|nr:glycoside hydrolase N-terminal domain-containing protein [Paenibacillus sp. B01]
MKRTVMALLLSLSMIGGALPAAPAPVRAAEGTADMPSENLDYGFGYYVIQNGVAPNGNTVLGYVGGADGRGAVWKYSGIDFTDLKSIRFIREQAGAANIELYVDLPEKASKTYFQDWQPSKGTAEQSRRYLLSDVTIDASKRVGSGNAPNGALNQTVALSKEIVGVHDLYVYARASGGTYAANFDSMSLSYEAGGSSAWKFGLGNALGFNEDTFKPIVKSGANNNWRDGSVTANGEIGFIESADPSEDVFIFNNTKIVTDNGNFYETPVLSPVLDAQRTGAVLSGGSGDFPWTQEYNRYSQEQYGANWGTTWPRDYQPAAQYRIKNNDYTSANASAGNYNRYTNFETGEVGVQWKDEQGNQWNRLSFASRSDEVIVTYIEAPQGRNLNLTLSIDHILEMKNQSNQGNNEEFPATDYVVTEQQGKVVGIGMVGKSPNLNRKGTKNVEKRLFAEGGWGTATRIVTDGAIKYEAKKRTFTPAADGRINYFRTGTAPVVANDPTLTITGTNTLLLVSKVDRIDEGAPSLADVKTKLYDKLLADINGVLAKYSVNSGKAELSGYKALLQPHAGIHGGMFNTVRLDLAETAAEKADRALTNSALIQKQNSNKNVINKAFLERIYNNGRFGLICASGYQSTRLGAIWTGTWKPDWSGDFTLDANNNLQVSGMNVGNMEGASQGYVNFIVRMVADWEDDAHNIYGMDNAIKAPPRVDGTGESGSYHFLNGYPHVYVNGITDWVILPIFEYWQTYGNRQVPVGKDIDFEKKSRSTGKTIADVLDLTAADVSRIKQTGLIDLQNDVLYPLVIKSMNFWLQYVDERFYTDGMGNHHLNDGSTLSDAVAGGDLKAQYLFTPGYSPENTRGDRASADGSNSIYALSYNTTMDIAAARNTLFMGRTLLDAVKPGDAGSIREKWAQLEQYIPDYVYEEETGELKEWADKNVPEQHRHRHESHAYPAWPGFEAQNDPALSEGIALAMDYRSAAYNGSEATQSHGATHKALVEARLKRPAGFEHAVKYLLTARYHYASLMTSHNSGLSSTYATDAAFGLMGAVNESLLYSNMGEIEILPTLLPSFNKGSVSGLRARNNTLVNQIAWDTAGKTASVTLTTDQSSVQLKLMNGLTWKRALVGGVAQTIKTDEAGRKYIDISLAKGASKTVQFELADASIAISSAEADRAGGLMAGTTASFQASVNPATAIRWFAVDAASGKPIPGVGISDQGVLSATKASAETAVGKTVKVHATTTDGRFKSNERLVPILANPSADRKVEMESFDYGFGHYVLSGGKLNYTGNGTGNQAVWKFSDIDFSSLDSIRFTRVYAGAATIKLYVDLQESVSKQFKDDYQTTRGDGQASRRYQISNVVLDESKRIASASVASSDMEPQLALTGAPSGGVHDLYVLVEVASGTWAGDYDFMSLNYS